MKHGSYGKARHTSTKYAKLLSDFGDDIAEANDVAIQTDTLPFQNGTPIPPNDWSLASSTDHHELVRTLSSADVNESYTSESIPSVTTEQTLQCLDIVSSSYCFFYVVCKQTAT